MFCFQQRGHTPAYYKKSKNSDDLDRSLLTFIPDAPRISEQGFPPNFDWKFLPAKFYDSRMKSTVSEFNLSSVNENGMKAANSAFELLSRSNSNLNEEEPRQQPETKVEPEPKEEVVAKKSAKKSARPKTFR